jgi:hypothetical protein
MKTWASHWRLSRYPECLVTGSGSVVTATIRPTAGAAAGGKISDRREPTAVARSTWSESDWGDFGLCPAPPLLLTFCAVQLRIRKAGKREEQGLKVIGRGVGLTTFLQALDGGKACQLRAVSRR